MTDRFTHFVVVEEGADLLAGDVIACHGCPRMIFRDHLFISDCERETAEEVPTVEAQLARGRIQLPENALRMDEGDVYCEYCAPDDKAAETCA
jgi:hypothetical protein